MEETPPLVTVSGPPAVGTTSLVEPLAEAFDYEVLNGGAVFRAMARERGVDLGTFTELAEDDPGIDRELDDRIRGAIEAHLEGRRDPDGAGLVVESRLAAYHADGRADLTVFLDAPAKVRTERIDDREESPAQLREREMSDVSRYRKFYGIDMNDLTVYDLVLDTATLSEEGVYRTVSTALEDVLDGDRG